MDIIQWLLLLMIDSAFQTKNSTINIELAMQAGLVVHDTLATCISSSLTDLFIINAKYRTQ